jgi:hypothetical protein
MSIVYIHQTLKTRIIFSCKEGPYSFNMIYQPSMIENMFCSSYGNIPFEVDQVSNHQNLSPHFGH